MVRRLVVSSLLLLAAARPAAAQKATTPQGAIAAFMQAVADSNVERLGQLWGTERGSAVRTKSPEGYEQRLLVMLAFLRGQTYRIAGAQPGDSKTRRDFMVEFTRDNCRKLAQVRTAESRQDGWLVNSIDLSALGVPGRPCDAGDGAAPAPQ